MQTRIKSTIRGIVMFSASNTPPIGRCVAQVAPEDFPSQSTLRSFTSSAASTFSCYRHFGGILEYRPSRRSSALFSVVVSVRRRRLTTSTEQRQQIRNPDGFVKLSELSRTRRRPSCALVRQTIPPSARGQAQPRRRYSRWCSNHSGPEAIRTEAPESR
jgi:hypothetical protein